MDVKTMGCAKRLNFLEERVSIAKFTSLTSAVVSGSFDQTIAVWYWESHDRRR